MVKGFSDPVSLQGTAMERVETAVPASPRSPPSCQQTWEDTNRRRKADAGGSLWGASLGSARIICSSFWLSLKGSTEGTAKG